MSSTVPMDAREHGEVAAIRHALAAGWLSADAVRAASSSDEGDLLLRLSSAARLPESALVALRQVARQASDAAVRRGLPDRAGPGRTQRVLQASLTPPPPPSPARGPWDDVPTREHDEVVPIPRAPRPTVEHVGVLSLPGSAPDAGSRTEVGAPPSPAKPEVRRRYGPYTVESELARGGMGVVYRARHTALGTEVALKVLLAGGAEGVEDRLRFEQEARTTAALVHPGIVAVRDYGVAEGGAPWLAMDLVRGESLRAKVAREGPLEPKLAARLLAAVARAVAHAHGQGVLHRDLKPHNVLVDEAGAARLTDFGLARRVDVTGAGLTVTGQILGTPAYMPPEQAGGVDAVDARSDVYGLGATLYELLTGRPPFQGVTVLHVLTAVLGSEPLSPAKLRPGLDRDLETIVLCCLEKEPARRYASASALADDLERFLEGAPVRARPLTPARRALRWGWRRHRPLGWAAVALAALGGLWAWVTRVDAAEVLRAAERRERDVVALPAPPTGDSEQIRALAALVVAQHPKNPRLAWVLVRRAEGLALRGNWSEALPLLDLVVASRPDSAVGRALRANLRIVAGRPGAREDVQAALALGTCPPQALDDLVDALLNMGRPSEALHAACASVAMYPGDPLPLRSRAVAWVGVGRPEAGLVDAKQALALAPTSDAGLTLASMYLELKDPASACKYLDPLIASGQWSGAAYLLRSVARLDLGDAAGAVEDATKLIEGGIMRLDVFLNRSEARRQLGDLVGAADDLRVIVGKDSTGTAARSLARLEFEQGHVEAALAAADVAIRAQPSNASARGLSINVAIERGELARAARELEALERDSPGALEVAFTRARLHLARGEATEAVTAARRAVTIDGRHPDALATLAEALLAAGQAEEARDVLARARARAPRDARYLELAVRIHVTRGDLPAARALVDEAIALPRAIGRVWNLRGLIRAQEGDPRAALADFDEALRRDPQLVTALANRATAHLELAERTGDPTEWAAAVADAEAALERAPVRVGAVHLIVAEGRAALGDLAGGVAASDSAVVALEGDHRGLLIRAELRLRQGDRAGAAADVAAIDEGRLSPAARPRLAKLRAALVGD